MAKTSAKTIYNEIEFNERRLLLLLSNDILWFKKNLANIKSHKNKKAFLKQKTLKYNQILKTTQELSEISNSLTRTDGEIITSPYVFLEQEKLIAQNIKIKDGIKTKNLNRPKLFEVVCFTYFVDLFNNPKSRKNPKSKCLQAVKRKVMDKNNNMPSCVLAREYYNKNPQNAEQILNDMYITSALYIKKDIELEMQIKQTKAVKKQTEVVLENTTKTRARKTVKEKPEKTKSEVKKETKVKQAPKTEEPKQKHKKLKYNTASKSFEYEFVDINDLEM